MEIYEFVSSDYELLKKLLKITKKIKLKYNELYNLELSGKKDSEEYNKLLKSLKYYIQMEDNLYEIIGTDINRLFLFYDYLCSNGGNDYEEEIEILKNSDENNIFKERIVCKISELILGYSFDEKKDEIDLEDDEKEQYDQEYKEYALIELSVQEDISNSILVMIEKYSKNKKYDFALDMLIKFKYNFLFTYKNIENTALKNNLDINIDLYLKSILLTDIYRKNKEDTLFTLNDYIDDLCKMEMQELMRLIREVKDENYRRKKLVLTALLLRTFIIFMDSIKVNNIKNILELESLLNMYDNDIVNEILTDIYKENNKDKEIPKILSLKQ